MDYKVRIENSIHVPDGEPLMVHEFILKGRDCLKDIVQWYGAFYAGDPIRVFVNGVEQELDQNHCIAQPRINGGVEVVWSQKSPSQGRAERIERWESSTKLRRMCL